MKYTASAMCVCFGVAIWYVAWRQNGWTAMLRQMGWQLLGGVLICLPFAIYLWKVNAFSAFIHEYFINTLFTVQEVGNTKYQDFLYLLVRFRPLQTFSFLLIWSCLMPLFCFKQNRWYPLLLFAWFIAPLFAWPKMYYMNVYTIFFIWWMISVFVMWNDRKVEQQKVVWLISGVAMFLFVGYNLRFNIRNFYDKDYPKYPKSVEASIIMAKMDMPTYMIWDAGEQGEGILANALPACKYWARQVGATKEMHDEQADAVNNKRADFIILQQRNGDATNELLYKERTKELLRLNYKKLISYEMADGLWTRTLFKRID